MILSLINVLQEDIAIELVQGVAKEVKLTQYQGSIMYQAVFDLPLLDAMDTYNAEKYSLIANFEASNEVTAYLCNSEVFVDCILWDYMKMYDATAHLITIDNYQEMFKELDMDLFIHFYGPENTMVKVAAQTVMQIGHDGQYDVDAGQDVYGLVVRCDQASFVLTTSPTARICLSPMAQPAEKDCTKILTGANNYPVTQEQFYSFVTILGGAEFESVPLEVVDVGTELVFEANNVQEIPAYPLCSRLFTFTAPKVSVVTVVQEIQTAGLRQEFESFTFDDTDYLAYGSDVITTLLPSSVDLYYVVYCTDTLIVMPWSNDRVPTHKMTIVFSHQLVEIDEDIEETVEGYYQVYNNLLKDSPVTRQGDSAPYQIIMEDFAIAADKPAQLTDIYGEKGDSCKMTLMGTQNVCQLKVDPFDMKSQIDVVEERVLYVNATTGDKVRISKTYEIEQDKLYYDVLEGGKAKYYFVNAKGLDIYSPFLLKSDSVNAQLIDVTLSIDMMLPQPTFDPAYVKHFQGVNISELLGEDFQGDNIIFIRIASEQTVSISFAVQTDLFTEFVLEPDIPKEMQLEKDEYSIVGFKIPDPVQTELNLAFYDAITFLMSYEGEVEEGCRVSVQRGDDIILGELNISINITSFMVPIDVESAYNDANMFVLMESTCKVKITMAAAAVFLIENQVNAMMPKAGKSLIFARQFTFGVDQQMDFMSADFKGELTVFACLHPVLFAEAELGKICQNETTKTFDANLQMWVDSFDQDPYQSFIYYTLRSSADDEIDLMVDETDLVYVEKDQDVNLVIQPYDTQIYFYLRTYKEDYFYINVDELTLGQIMIYYDDSETPIKTIDKPGAEHMKISDAAEWVFIAITSFSNTAEQVKFKGVFYQTLVKPFTIDTIYAGKPKNYIFTRKDKNNDVVFGAVKRRTDYQNEIIPDDMFQRVVELYVNQGNVANKTAYVAHQAQAGPQAVAFVGGLIQDDTFLIAVYSNENTKVEITAKEVRNGYMVPYGDEEWIEVDEVDTADFILDSAYSPSGATIEQCSGELDEVYFSYYHLPSSDPSFATKVDIKGTTTGLIKALLNSTDDRQNFFASVKTKGKASYIIRHGFSEARPTTADPTIWVPKSGGDGILTLQVDPVQYQRTVKYQVFVIEDQAIKNSTACGVMLGRSISDEVLVEQGKDVVKITTNTALEVGKNYTLNIVSYDALTGGEAVAFKPIFVWRGMAAIDPGFHGREDATDLTWLIWMFMAIILVAVGVVVFFFMRKKKGYQLLVEEQKAKNVKDLYKQEVAGALENSDL